MSSFKTFIEIEVEVDYDYQPLEPQTRDYPGCDADLTVNAVEVALPKGSIRIGRYPDISTYLTKPMLENLEQQCFENENQSRKE